MPGDERDEIQAPPLPRYSGDSKVAATFHDGTGAHDDCEGCADRPNATCTHIRRRPAIQSRSTP